MVREGGNGCPSTADHDLDRQGRDHDCHHGHLLPTSADLVMLGYVSLRMSVQCESTLVKRMRLDQQPAEIELVTP